MALVLMQRIAVLFDLLPSDGARDVSPPSGPLNDPVWLFAIAAFGFSVVMVVWIRRRRATR